MVEWWAGGTSGQEEALPTKFKDLTNVSWANPFDLIADSSGQIATTFPLAFQRL